MVSPQYGGFAWCYTSEKNLLCSFCTYGFAGDTATPAIQLHDIKSILWTAPERQRGGYLALAVACALSAKRT